MPKDPHAPMRYELRIAGHLGQHWSAWFGGLAITQEDDGTTTLRGVVSDQSELHGLLAKVRDLGAALISVTPINVAHDADSSSGNTARSSDRRDGRGSAHPQTCSPPIPLKQAKPMSIITPAAATSAARPRDPD